MPRILLFFIILAFLPACNDEPDSEESPIENFTRTNQNGQIISSDATDWRIANRFSGEIAFSQVPYPNPTATAQVQLTLQFASSIGFAQLDFIGITKDGVPVNYPVILETDLNPPSRGAKTYRIDLAKISPNRNLSDLRGRLFRVRLIDGGGNLISYGDVQIE
jgi:hypothetical protein